MTVTVEEDQINPPICSPGAFIQHNVQCHSTFMSKRETSKFNDAIHVMTRKLMFMCIKEVIFHTEWLVRSGEITLYTECNLNKKH